jgi:hypothetical protein
MTLLTSWHMLVGRAKITPGQTVLIMGGGNSTHYGWWFWCWKLWYSNCQIV